VKKKSGQKIKILAHSENLKSKLILSHCGPKTPKIQLKISLKISL
jgi:hypothetical protein